MNLNIYKKLLRPCFSTAAPIYSNSAVNKIVVYRTPAEAHSFYFQYSTTIQQFKQHISSCFPDTQIEIATEFGGLGNKFTDSTNYESIKNLQFIDALILNKLYVFEVSEHSDIQLLYGVEISELNMTNKINIPEHVENAITELNSEWSSKMTIDQALDFKNIRRLEDGPLNRQTGNERKFQWEAEEKDLYSQQITTMRLFKAFQKQDTIQFGESKKLLLKILGMMSANWVFLFAVTYGKYGWDVGEPLSYLTSLGVDLVAMIGIFEADRMLESRTELDKRMLQNQMNMESANRMAEWRVSYLLRKL